jgi:hypothetical protein
MKNIHVIPTDKPSRLYYFGNSPELRLTKYPNLFRVFERSTQNIYITSDEEIKEGDYVYDLITNTVYQLFEKPTKNEFKIILTTDQDLIKFTAENDGVQAIDDEFLQWFVKNPSCERVEVIHWEGYSDIGLLNYEIIIPKEQQRQHIIDMMKSDEELGLYDEPKQESFVEKMIPLQLRYNLDNIKQATLEEVAHKMLDDYGIKSMGQSIGVLEVKKLMVKMAKWQQEGSYSEEEVIDFLQEMNDWPTTFEGRIDIREWFKQLKKNI